MKKHWNRKVFCLAASALVLTAGASAGKALAYFTTYASASGGATLEMGFTTTIPHETMDEDWIKHVTVENTGDYECYVRVRAFAGSQVALNYQEPDGASNWSKEADGYYYYKQILAPGASTSELQIKITKPEDADEAFNVIVVQEHTAVLYKADGTSYYNWSLKSSAEGNQGGEQP